MDVHAYHNDQIFATAYNYLPEIREQYNLPEKVRLYDVTLREIDQTPGVIVRGQEKIAIAKDLNELGVWAAEIFPIVSQEDFEALKEISSWKDRKIETSGLCRVIPADIDRVAEAGADRAMIESPISMAFGALYGNKSPEDILKRMKDAIKYAQSLGFTKITCEAWDAAKTDINFMERFYKEIAETGVDQIVFADSGNSMLPWTVYNMVKKVIGWTEGKVEIVPHFHNDFGNALASTLAAIAAGCTTAHCAINNAGEKTGNCAIDELVVNLELLLGIDTGINMKKLHPISKKVGEIGKVGINHNKPVTGRRPYMLGSGLVAEAFLQMDNKYDQMTFLPFDPAVVGAPEPEIVWGKGCGAKMVQMHALSKLGIELNKDQAAYVRDRVKSESLVQKAAITEAEVNMFIQEVAEKK